MFENVLPEVTEKFGTRHREIRRSKKISQVVAAKAYGISQGQLSKLERGEGYKRRGPKLSWGVSVETISKTLKVMPKRLFG